MATRTLNQTRQPSSRYRVLCIECNGSGCYLRPGATSWDAGEACSACAGEGEVCAECGQAVKTTDPLTPHGCEGPADPADVLCIRGYYANLEGRFTLDDVWTRNGAVYAQVSPVRSAEEPPDATIYRYALVERTINGEDVEAVQFTPVGWINGASGAVSWNDESEQAFDHDEGR